MLSGDAGRPRIHEVEEEEEILGYFQRDPTFSTRIVARILGLSQYKVWYTLHEQNSHPYHYTPVQVIEEGDPVRRVQFCRFILHSNDEDEDYLRRILWTDESTFDTDGITNYHNAHYWREKELGNPHLHRPKGSQRRFKLNVWMGIINRHLIGPYFLPDNLNGEAYEDFLRNSLYELIENVPLETRRHLVFQHDGCPAHFRITVRQYLNHQYPNRWIGRGGPIPWPARSPDLTPMDFFVWGRMKTLVYYDNRPVPNIIELRRRIIDAAAQIKMEITNSRIVKSEVIKRARICLRNRGRHFENEL